MTIGNHVACVLATGSGQDKTQFTPHFDSRPDKTVSKFSVADSLDLSTIQFTADNDKTRRQSCLVDVGGVN